MHFFKGNKKSAGTARGSRHTESVRRIYVNMVEQEPMKRHAIQPFDFFIRRNRVDCDNDPSAALPRAHDKCEIYVNLNGDAAVSVENNIYAASYGCVCITRPGEKHGFIYNGRSSDLPHEYYTIQFSAAGNEGLLDLFFKRPAGQNNLLPLPPETAREIISLCDSLLNASENSFKAQFDFWSIVRILTENFRLGDMSGLNKYPDVCVSLDYINKNFTEPIYLETLVKISNVSVSTLERHFSLLFNMTPREYVKQKRLTYAAELLQNGESVSNVAFKSGFSDYSRFISVFKKQFGTTPLKYQKSKRKS